MGEHISRNEAGRRLGVTGTAIRNAIRDGRLTVEDDGLLDWDKAQVDWDANRSRPVNKRRSRSKSATSTPRESDEPSADDVESAPDAPEGTTRRRLTLVQAQTSKTAIEAQMSGLRLRELQGVLVRKDRVTDYVFQVFREERDALLALPARYSAELADKLGVDHRTLHNELETIVRRYLTERARLRSPDF